jgi:hypothetical protein
MGLLRFKPPALNAHQSFFSLQKPASVFICQPPKVAEVALDIIVLVHIYIYHNSYTNADRDSEKQFMIGQRVRNSLLVRE